MELKIGRKSKFKNEGTLELVTEIKRFVALDHPKGTRAYKVEIEDMELDQKAVDEAAHYVLKCNDEGDVIVSPSSTKSIRFIIKRK